MKKRFVRVLFLTALYNFVSNFIHPVTPTLITQLGLPDRMFGMLFAAMALGNFLFSPIWGRLADRKGRRIVLILSFLGYAAGQAVFGFCHNATVMLLARFFGGCMTGGTSVALLACVVDISDDSTRTSNLSLFAAVQSVFGAMGYFTGGMLGLISISFVFVMHVSILVLAAVLAAIILPDIALAKEEGAQKHSLAAVAQMLSMPMALFFLGVIFANISSTGFDNAFNYFICREFGFPSSVNGTIKAVTGILGLLANLFLNRWIANHFESGKSLASVLSLCAAVLLAASLQTSVVPFIGMNVVFYVLNATYVPIQQSLMTGKSDSDYGLLSGIFNASKSLGMVAGSLSAGLLYEVNARLPFFTQVACFLLAALFSILSQRLIRKEQGGK